jgi:hypothetical protein
MKTSFLWVTIVAVLAAAGCSTPKTNEHDYDTTYNFSPLKTYGWLPSPPGDQMQEMTEQRVQGAVNSQLQAKGYSRSAEAADFLVSVEGIKKTVNGGSTGVGASISVPVGNRASMSLGGGKSRSREKMEGTLSLNIVDAKTKKVIWKGTSSAEIKGKGTPEEQQQRIDKVIGEMLKSFPPEKGH